MTQSTPPSQRTSPSNALHAARRALSRRQFVRLLAVGSAAAMTGVAARIRPAAAAGRAAKPATGKPTAARPEVANKPGSRHWTPGEAKEIARQAAQVEDALKKIRAYPLPAGSEPAVHFAVLRPARRGERT